MLLLIIVLILCFGLGGGGIYLNQPMLQHGGIGLGTLLVIILICYLLFSNR
jgi:hypothetical protein